MKKILLLISVIIITVLASYSYSNDEIWTLHIDQTEIKTSLPIISVDNTIFLPMVSTFETLGAKVYNQDSIIAYYLNSFLKVNLEENNYAVNGKVFKFKNDPFYQNDILYVPLEVLKLTFDLVEDKKEDTNLYLKANTVIQYRYFDNIQYKQVSFDDQGARFSIPLDWQFLQENMYGYDSNYGRINVVFSSVELNENVDKFVVMKTFEEHLLIEYPTNIRSINQAESIFDNLTNNVLYIDLEVNEKLYKKRVHFINFDNDIYLLDFQYPKDISESYMNRVMQNMISSFHIDSLTFDESSEHYFETNTARKLELRLNEDIYANMTVNNKFYFSGDLKSDEVIESLTISISRDDDHVEYYVPLVDNYFETWIYTPFGLGKHNIKVAITGQDEKVVFEPDLPSDERQSNARDLLHLSVVNIDNTPLRHLIPTKMVQSQHEYITSMSQLITYRNNTLYSKARSVYDFIIENVDVLPINTINYSALDVYLQYEGTKMEIAYFITALLRAQNIPARIVVASNDFAQHLWVEANLNGRWLIIDTIGDETYTDLLTQEVILPLLPTFNGSVNQYQDRYPYQIITDH